MIRSIENFVITSRSVEGTVYPTALSVPIPKYSSRNNDNTLMRSGDQSLPYNPYSRLMRIKLKSYEPSSVMLSCSRLISSLQTKQLASKEFEKRKRPRYTKKKKETNVYEKIVGLLSLKGPIPLPTRRRKYCLLRSPHVNKTSRDHYEINIHKRLLYVEFCDKVVLDHLRCVDILPGVQIDIIYD
jgi:small subunit ribosomal protein S10